MVRGVLMARPHPQDVYWVARREYAFMLRCEGLSTREIGGRLGVGSDQVRNMVGRVGHELARAMRHTKVSIT